MPTEFLTTCSEPGCGELVKGGRCRRHQKIRAREVRNKSLGWNWVYNSRRWKALRRQVRIEQPFCHIVGCMEMTAEVDHIVALQDGGNPFDRDNVQGLCRAHHSAKTNEEVRARG